MIFAGCDIIESGDTNGDESLLSDFWVHSALRWELRVRAADDPFNDEALWSLIGRSGVSGSTNHVEGLHGHSNKATTGLRPDLSAFEAHGEAKN
jgi:hypothetical protein